jgi:hypothetical protein
LADAPASSDELSFDVSSSSFIKDVPSSPPVEPFSPIDPSPEQLVRRSHRLHMPSDCYSPSAFTAIALFESTSYHDAILHPEWQHAMVEEIAALERTDTWNLVPCHHVFVLSLISGFIRLRLALMVLLSTIRLILLLLVSVGAMS